MTLPTAEEIKKIFDNYFVADVNLWSEFSQHIKIRNFNKNEIIKDYHKTEKFVNILVRGSVGQFVVIGK